MPHLHHYAVIGNPVKHSLSPQIHTLFAEQTHQPIYYDKIEAPPAEFKQVVQQFVKEGGQGFSITTPFKHEAYELADILDESAKRCGAVNAVHVKDNKLIGHNTDGAGLLIDLKKNLKFNIQAKRVLLIGAGGAAQGVLPNLLDENPEQIVIVNRTLEKAQTLVSYFQNPCLVACGFNDVPLKPFDLVINATTSSLVKIDLPLPETIFSTHSLSYDLMYNRNEATPFVAWSNAHGASRAVDGLGMLIEQAALAFKIWRGVYPETGEVFKRLSQK